MNKPQELLKSVVTFDEYDRDLSEFDKKRGGVIFLETVENILLTHADKFKINIDTKELSPHVSGKIEDESFEPQSIDDFFNDNRLGVRVSMDPNDGRGGPNIELSEQDDTGTHTRHNYVLESDGVVYRGDTDEDALHALDTRDFNAANEDNASALEDRIFNSLVAFRKKAIEQAENYQTEVTLGFNYQPVGTEEVKKLIALIETAQF